MPHKQPEQPAAAADSIPEDKLRDLLLSRISKHLKDLEIDHLFRALVKLEGSDLHLKVGRPPMLTTAGQVRPSLACRAGKS